MIVGASDTGKTTLAQFLYQDLSLQGVQAAYLDADVGQSTLGLPTTLTLALASGPGDDRFPPRGTRVAFFVGAVTPRGHMLPTVIGTYRLQHQAIALGAQAIVVDTTGLVDRTQGGKALKQWKIELLAPSLVIGIQRGNELEPILWPLRRDDRVRCVELATSPHVRERSREDRIARRQERLARYFDGTHTRQVCLRRLAVYDLERFTTGALLAFQDAAGFTLALGAVEEADRSGATCTVRTPLPDLDSVRSVRFGAARWDCTNNREW